ncbi:MAG: hypothetical protein PHF35_02885 [Candidatus Moranbacteria bacterium]|nr:hypothetical protein [Candidatus Moranbacteria bacterium]
MNPKTKTYLDRLVSSKSRPGSFLFVGMDQEAKEEAGYYFVSKIAGKSGDSDFLEKAKRKNHPDVIVIEPEIEEKKGKIREKEIGIPQIREVLERLKFFPYELEKKFCIIRGGEKLNAEAANALLKKIEEPTEKEIFLILADNLEMILPTIVSRCAVLRFPETDLPKWSEENRAKMREILTAEIFERFDFVEQAAKNKKDFSKQLSDWEKVMAESLRKLAASGEDRRKVKKVVELLEDTREAINRLEKTNANARGVGEKMVLGF